MHQWSCFQKYIAVLEHDTFRIAEGQNRILRSTLKGEAAHRITQGANILWLSTFLPQPLGQDLVTRYSLDPSDLAALVAAMTAEGRDMEAGSLPVLPPFVGTAAPVKALDWLLQHRWHLWEVQLRHGVYEPIPLSLDAFRVTKLWASRRESWQELVAAAGMAEGDVFRLIRRTLDARIILDHFKAVCNADNSSELWRAQVQEAQERLSRRPVAENQQACPTKNPGAVREYVGL
eukprot:Skav230652  [mRNA]  locus=scaffold2103:166573:173298:- [translate_table: standard]